MRVSNIALITCCCASRENDSFSMYVSAIQESYLSVGVGGLLKTSGC